LIGFFIVAAKANTLRIPLESNAMALLESQE
jgi:hypothetical protein